MTDTKTLLELFTVERPIGSDNNQKLLSELEKRFERCGLKVTSLPLSCSLWSRKESSLSFTNGSITVYASPFSERADVTAELVYAETLLDLKEKDVTGEILVLSGELCKEQLQSKNNPFYYPDEHKLIIETLEEKKPAAIITITRKSEMCGLDPFPLFTDGNFNIPSCYLSKKQLIKLKQIKGKSHLLILSGNKRVETRQLLAQKETDKPLGTILVCAHMDSQYGTPGCLDNASGLAVLTRMAEMLPEINYNIDIVPFNSEEYYEGNGELAYLSYLQREEIQPAIVINIDSPAHRGAKNAFCTFNLPIETEQKLNTILEQDSSIEHGPEWYAGDHSAFAFTGVPCLAISSSDMFEGGLSNTHTERDTIDEADTELVEKAAKFVVKVISVL